MLAIFVLCFGSTINAQTADRGNINFHLGTFLGVFNTYSMGYESRPILAADEHQFRMNARIGGWINESFGIDKGSLVSLGGTYLLGYKHCLELSIDGVFLFDKSPEGQPFRRYDILYRPFLGYRCIDPQKRAFARVGVGRIELIQIGFGFRL